MYEPHFGLTRPPFPDSLDPDEWVELGSHAAALRRLEYGLCHVGGAALVYGPPGAGKTLLVRRYAASHVGPVVHLGFSALPGQELLRYVARQLGVTDSDDAVETLTGLRGCLSRICAEGRRPLWIIDDAQHIPNVATLEHIRMLSELDATNRPLVDLVLCGTAELVLRLPPALADRMSARCLLSVLSEEETSLYVNERLVRAGGSPELFTKPAIRALHQAANGLPRRMNRLADLALLITFGRSGKRVEPDAVDLAARDYAAMAV